MAKYKAGIVAVAKDEHPYLLEWLAFHFAIGFDHIWVYDNESAPPLSRLISHRATREGAYRSRPTTIFFGHSVAT
jgi:hypothetical protein